MERRPNYLIYPSLLDKFQSLLNYEQEAEMPWNFWTENKVAEYIAEAKMANETASFHMPIVPPQVGDYILTPDEMYEKIESELIDSINRVPHEPCMAADRGTALNEIIDCMILGTPCQREDMTIQSLRLDNGTPYAIKACINDFEFQFSTDLCRTLRDMLKDGLCQYMVSADVETKYGIVNLYGYLDYWIRDHVVDLKTTSYYAFGNYERKWQRYVYPYCCIESGLTDKITDFTFLAVQLTKGTIINGSIYPETYDYDHADATRRIKMMLERFIEWLESDEIRCQITDKKIFNKLIA